MSAVRDNRGNSWRPRPELEGPFKYKTGVVLYWDPRAQQYYCPVRDMFLDSREFREVTGERPDPARVALRKMAQIPRGVSRFNGQTLHYEVLLENSTYCKDDLSVNVKGTPGKWCLKDFMRGSGPIAIDYGQKWFLDNADEIRAGIRKMFPAQFGTPQEKMREWVRRGKPLEVGDQIRGRSPEHGDLEGEILSFSRNGPVVRFRGEDVVLFNVRPIF